MRSDPTISARSITERTNVVYGFDEAIKWLKGGRKIARSGWNGKGMFIYLVGLSFETIGEHSDTQPLMSVLGEGNNITCQSRIDMKFANGEIGIWTPTHEDILAKDWNVLV